MYIWNDIKNFQTHDCKYFLFQLTTHNQDTKWNIFFHEACCFDKNGLALNSRQACAVEFAVKMNPDMNIHLLFLSPSKISRRFRRLFKQLQTYPNIHIKHIKLEDYMKNIPLDAWYKTEILKKSK